MTPRQLHFMQLLAHAYLRGGLPRKACVLLAAADAMAPGQRRVLRALAYAQLSCGDAGAALESLERVALAGGIDAAWHLLRARTLMACGRRIEAGAAMAACLAIRRALVPPTPEAMA